MKRFVIFVLAIVLVMGLAAPAYAVGSPTATRQDIKRFLISATSDEYGIYTVDETYKLSEEGQQSMVDARLALKAAVPQGMHARYFFYFYTNASCSALFEIECYTELLFMQFVDGEWVTLEHTDNGDGTYTVKDVVDAPMAICFR